MTAKEALKAMCERCHREIQAQPSKGDFPHMECPFRHISDDYCEEYETVEEMLRKQNEILDVLKSRAKIVTPLMGPNEPEYYQTVQILIYAGDEKMPLIRKWLEENE